MQKKYTKMRIFWNEDILSWPLTTETELGFLGSLKGDLIEASKTVKSDEAKRNHSLWQRGQEL